jgi:hypothetical protein
MLYNPAQVLLFGPRLVTAILTLFSALSTFVLSRAAPWSGDRLPHFHLPPFFILKRKFKQPFA